MAKQQSVGLRAMNKPASGTMSRLTGQWSLERNLLDYAKPYRLRFALVLAQVFIVSAVELLKPWPLKLIVDNALGGKPLAFVHGLPAWLDISALQPMALVTFACLALIAIHVAAGGLLVFYNWVSIGLGQSMVNELRLRLYAHLQRLSLAFHGRQRIGDLMMRVTGDSFAVQTVIMNGLLPILQSTILLVGMIFILAPINLTLSIVSLSIVPAMAILMGYFNGRIERVATVARDADSKVNSLVHWGIAGIKHIQAFTKEDTEHRRFMHASGSALHANRLLYTWQTVYSVMTSLLIALGTGAVLFIGAREVLANRLTLGELLVFSAYLAQLYVPVNQIAQSWGLIAGARIGARRCFEVLEEEAELPNGHVQYDPRNSNGRIEWKNVSFQYRTDAPVLHDISLAVDPGQTVALVGVTGAGKSTMLSLLARFFDPVSGQVLVNGVDIRDYDIRSFRRQIAMVLQPPLIFPISIADNIAYGREEATREEIMEAARLARIDDTIRSLPDGYETMVNDGATMFSEGQKQRIAIARAILRDAPILILDEPTSALDTETEAAVIEALDRLTKGKTTFVIAHRLSTIRNADKILVLKDGTIAEQGTYDELLAMNGAFANLHKAQFSPKGRALPAKEN